MADRFPKSYRSRARALRWLPALLAVLLLAANLALVVLSWPLPASGVLFLILPLALPLYVLHRTLTTYFDVRLDLEAVELQGYRRHLRIDLDDVVAVEADTGGAPILRHKQGRARLLLFREELQEFVGDLRSLEPGIEVRALPKGGSPRSPLRPEDR